MRRLTVLFVFGSLVTALASPARAEDTLVQEEDKVVYNKKTVIDFSDVSIEGELTKPEGSYIKNRKRTRFKNLIELRGNFRPELTRSVSAL